MSLALIQETAKEVRRLSVAGSRLAVGDFRLKKLIPPLEQAGAKVPVFAQVAKGISELVNGNEKDSAAYLLTLSTLLNAILYTQGQTGADGEPRDLELFAAKSTSTRTTARVLKPLVVALTSTGSGRFEQVESAFERGAFNDLRLIEPAIRALDDVYPELADLVAEKVLPGYGPGIIPLLKQKLDLKGKRSDGRRLQIIHQLDPAGTVELCKTALEDGSPEVKASAIACLGQHEDCLPLVQEQAKAKNKALRAAALEALARHEQSDITKLFIEMIKGKTLEALVQPMRAMRNPQVVNALLAEGRRVFDLVLKGDAEAISRYWEILDCLALRKEAAEFLLDCFNQGDKVVKLKAAKNYSVTGADLMGRLAGLLHGVGSPQALEAVVAKRDLVPPAAFCHVFRSALQIWPPDKVYEHFSPLFEQKKGGAKEKRQEIQHVIWYSSRGRDDEDYAGDEEAGTGEPPRKFDWDPRWLDVAIKADEPELVCSLARPGHAAAVNYLVKATER